MLLNLFSETTRVNGREERREDMIRKDGRQRKRCIEQMVVYSQVYKDLQRKICCTEGRRQRWRDR